jgi:hypothetical protein
MTKRRMKKRKRTRKKRKRKMTMMMMTQTTKADDTGVEDDVPLAGEIETWTRMMMHTSDEDDPQVC